MRRQRTRKAAVQRWWTRLAGPADCDSFTPAGVNPAHVCYSSLVNPGGGAVMLVLDQVRDLERRVVSRLRELEPLMREYEQLREAAQRLGVRYTPRADRTPGEQRPASRRRTSRATPQPTPERAAGTATARRATRAAKTTARA